MEPRIFTPIDRVIGEIANIINVLAAPVRAKREYPANRVEDSSLSAEQRLQSARLMRVNHAGEIAAQALYQGQALFARKPEVRAALQRAGEEELDHLGWCEQRLSELNGRTSLLNPLWYAGSFAIGALAALAGDETSLGFVAETENQVEAHLSGHLQRLPGSDQRSRSIVEAMKDDEARHGADATALGGRALPKTIQVGMQLTSRLMTSGSYWL